MKDSAFEGVLTNIGNGIPTLVCMVVGLSLILLTTPQPLLIDSVECEIGPNDLYFNLFSSYGTYVVIEPISSTGDVHYQLVRDGLNCGWRHFTPGCSAGFVISENSHMLFRGNGTIRFTLTYYESRP